MRLSFTFDESLTFLAFVRGPWKALVDFRSPLSPNNHLLNTLLLRALAPALGDSEFVLRLPSLLAHLAYLAASYRLVRKLERPILVASGFLLLNTNPFVLDFFSLSRGYGLALAALEASLALCVGALETPGEASGGRELLALGLGALAVAANFAYFTFFASLALLILLRRRLEGRPLSAILALAGAVGISAGVPIWLLRTSNLLYFGGKDGFWKDTVGTLVKVTSYGHPPAPPVQLALELAIGAATAACAWQAVQGRRRGTGASLAGSAPLFLLLGCAGAAVAAHMLFGVRYLISRAALLYVPLFLHAVLAFCSAGRGPAGRRLGAAFAAALALLSTANFARAANFTYDLTWKNESQTREFFEDFEAAHRSSSGAPGPPTCLTVSWVIHYSAEYYRATRHLDWISEIRDIPPRGKAPECENYFTCGWDAPAMAKTGATVVKEYPVNPNFWARRVGARSQ